MEKNSHCFIECKVCELLKRFNLSCFPQETYNIYYLREKDHEEIFSRELVLTLNNFSHDIHVSKFYPEIFHHSNCKYLSAACFYLLVQHFYAEKNLNCPHTISLNCMPKVFDDFYVKLKDFHFVNTGKALGAIVSASSDLEISHLDTMSMISHENLCERDLLYT